MSAEDSNGILLIDKPVGVSSFQALYPVKRAFGGKKGSKIGHAGTLDPAASGLLVLGVGSGTRLLEFLEALHKSYRFTLKLGVATDTYDLDGEVLERKDASAVTRASLEALLPRFRGDISQVPPAYSAIKVDGKRAYERARAGETVEMTARPVHVDRLEITHFEPGPAASAVMELDCSKGTYVRTLAHDLGQLLGCGAVAADIRRTAIGPFRVEDAVAPDAADAAHLTPVENAVDHLAPVEVKADWVASLLHGNAVPAGGYSARPARDGHGATARDTACAVFSPAGKLLAIGELNPLGHLQPRKVFPAP
ncbi:MAG: truB [Fibrobacteria bacterium]|jgi:tRNA pseudouridine55 synthase|nr:truB [Fibrobacteria bacterium]